MKVGSERCQCAACGQYFAGLEAFDAHRVGSYNPDTRKCHQRVAQAPRSRFLSLAEVGMLRRSKSAQNRVYGGLQGISQNGR